MLDFILFTTLVSFDFELFRRKTVVQRYGYFSKCSTALTLMASENLRLTTYLSGIAITSQNVSFFHCNDKHVVSPGVGNFGAVNPNTEHENHSNNIYSLPSSLRRGVLYTSYFR